MFYFLAETTSHWVHNLDPFIFRFNENFGIRWYGLSYLLGFLVAYLLWRMYYKKGHSPLAPEDQSNLITYIILGVLIGGRLGYMFLYEAGREDLSESLGNILLVWKGGMASHGGFLGVAIAVLLFARKYRFNHFLIGDLISSTAPAGLLFGRLANFINGELWGKVTNVSWAVIFPDAKDGMLPRHPSQLYEAAGEGLILLLYVQHRVWRNEIMKKIPGQLTGEMLIGYSIARIICEKFREPDFEEDLVWGMSKGQLYSLGLIAAGVVIIVLARNRAARKLTDAGRNSSSPAQ